ncbi:uncharacterized protein MYCFIDRAFT_170850 [Pseudocercospora fijiensis CIRAD86]|uniref:Uncharacterized protein n=1 Tax=Pseudocercospora fijiensis (strain CIRAD86) TaxID=383855 RepID=N1QBD2_PSEFD|nr:uncharacterized protein MYCFIDRAFT_170850 [Pseudocercospora fijiensis CIRAD86]EME89391.1 hypothetical protein MYCFIDRAFT_170850 [Pseudocercospora fijiensis CIRAD86]
MTDEMTSAQYRRLSEKHAICEGVHQQCCAYKFGGTMLSCYTCHEQHRSLVLGENSSEGG